MEMTKEERKNLKAMLKEIGTKETFKKWYEYEGFTMGCFNQEIEKLSFENIVTLIEEMEMNESGEYTITHNRKTWMIEYDTVNQERDVTIKLFTDYENQYGEIENRY